MAIKTLDIVMAVPGMPLSHDILTRKSVGGSETMGLQMAKALSNRGHFVVLFCNLDGKPGKAADGVIYLPIDQFQTYATTSPHDVCIIQRAPELFSAPYQSKLNILWCHDLALGRQMEVFRSVMWNVDKVMTVSKYMSEQYKEVYSIPDTAIMTTRNCIDTSMVKPMGLERNPYQLVYTARPERGLDVLLETVMPEIWKRVPQATLKIAGYDNTVPQMADFYAYIRGLVANTQGKAQWLPPLTKEQLYNLYAQSALYVYPTPSHRSPEFVEVSCITAMECAGLDLPFISTKNGALPETAAGRPGKLINPGEGYINEFVDCVCDYLTCANTDIKIEGEPQNHGMDTLAEEWEQAFITCIKERNNSTSRLTAHFERHSDIMAIKALGEPIKDDWAFVANEESYREHHREAGVITDERLSKVEWKDEHFQFSNEKRFALIEQCIAQSSTPIKNILDYGCGHGWCDVYMERRIGRSWTGIDVDPGAIKWSRYFAENFGKVPDNFSFFTDKEWSENDAGDFDCLIMSEVLEHCLDPKAIVESQERRLKRGALVLITVPYGPRELPDYGRIKHRQHIHELDFHSIRDMFGAKPGIEIIAVHEDVIEQTSEPAGFYLVRYRADHKPLGDIDMERKLQLQRPPETVSAAMIAGPGAEQTLHWCLQSIAPVVMECVIVDCGMSDEGRRIAEQYKFVRIVSGPDPKEVGFDEARNESIKHCKGDWILWIDSDEKLLGTPNLTKYLRNNMYKGYSIRQHHFAVDTTFKPDMPVRLIRRDSGVKFFGCIHEHPETELNEGPGVSIILCDVHIAHVGYLWEPDRKKRFWRNAPLLKMSEDKYPDRILDKYFRMRDNMLSCDYILRKDNRITDEIRALCEKTIELHRKHFLGKPSYMNGDALEHYSKACAVLGLGQQVTFNVTNGSGEPMLMRAWFANEEDLQKELAWRAGELMGKLKNKWW